MAPAARAHIGNCEETIEVLLSRLAVRRRPATDLGDPRSPADIIEMQTKQMTVPGPIYRVIVNALAERFSMTTGHGEKVCKRIFAEGGPIAEFGTNVPDSDNDRTRINFIPSAQIFTQRDFGYEVIYQRPCDQLALNRGERFRLEDMPANRLARADLLLED